MRRLNLITKEYVIIEKRELYELLDRIRNRTFGIDTYVSDLGFNRDEKWLNIVKDSITEFNDDISSEVGKYLELL